MQLLFQSAGAILGEKMPVISVKEALASMEQVQKLIAIADFELQKFGSRIWQHGYRQQITQIFSKESA